MKVYNFLLQEIKNQLSKENVQSDENQISLYDLYNLVNDKYEDLRGITQNKKTFTNKELFRRPSYRSLYFGYDKKKTSIDVWFKDSSSIYIQKEHGSKEFFVTRFHCPKEKEVNNFLKKYYDEIMQTLFTLEKYGAKLYGFKESVNKFNIEYNNYEFNIFINSRGSVDLKINLKKGIANKEIYERQYYGTDTLMKILEDSRFELAKKVKIDVNTLEIPLINVIEESRKNNNKKLVK